MLGRQSLFRNMLSRQWGDAEVYVALHLLDLGAKGGVVVVFTSRPFYPQEREPVPIA